MSVNGRWIMCFLGSVFCDPTGGGELLCDDLVGGSVANFNRWVASLA